MMSLSDKDPQWFLPAAEYFKVNFALWKYTTSLKQIHAQMFWYLCSPVLFFSRLFFVDLYINFWLESLGLKCGASI